MDEQLRPVVAALQERFQAQTCEMCDEVTLIVPPETIIATLLALRDEFGFRMLSNLTAVDYWPQESPRFMLVYHVRSLSQNLILGLRTPLTGTFPSLPTAERVFPNANWFEREVWDMFGIHFEGHSDLRRLIMPADWQGHPLRKDYPLGYEEVMFTFNTDEIAQRKPHPKN